MLNDLDLWHLNFITRRDRKLLAGVSCSKSERARPRWHFHAIIIYHFKCHKQRVLRRIVNCFLTAPCRNILTYLFTSTQLPFTGSETLSLWSRFRNNIWLRDRKSVVDYIYLVLWYIGLQTDSYMVTGWVLGLLKASARGGWVICYSREQPRNDSVFIEGHYRWYRKVCLFTSHAAAVKLISHRSRILGWLSENFAAVGGIVARRRHRCHLQNSNRCKLTWTEEKRFSLSNRL